MEKQKKNKPVKRMIELGIGNLVGISMISATANVHSSMPAGTAKTITGIVPGLQATALLGENLKMFKTKNIRRKKK